jgi:CRISPR-associated protein Cas2
MMVLISYDIMVSSEDGPKRLRKIAKECTNFGQRVQYSVFECILDPAQWILLKHRIESIMNKEKDSLRYYYLGSNWSNKIEHVGAKETIDLQGPLLI